MAHTVEDTGFTLCYRDADSPSLQELRLLSHFFLHESPGPALPAASSFSRAQLLNLKVRLDDSRVEFEANLNAAKVVKGDRD